jgi:hypothetical protein
MRLLLLPSLLLLAACGGMVSDSGDAGDASATDAPVGYDVVIKPDASPPPPFDGGGCNDVALLGADVSLNAIPQGPPPTAAGGPPPPPATYALESGTLYTGQGGPSGPVAKVNITIRIENGGATYQVAESQDGKPVDRRTYQLGKTGAPYGYTLTATCGGSDSTPVTFIPINSPGFVLLAGSGNMTTIEVFRPFIK